MHLLVGPVVGQHEVATIRPDRIFLLHGGVAELRLDERRIVQIRIGDVGIDGCAVAFHLPVRRHVNLVPCRHVVGGFIKILRPFVGCRHPMELPLAVEQHVTARPRALPWFFPCRVGHHVGRCGKRNIGGMAVELVDAEHAFVLPVVFALGASLDDVQLHIRRLEHPLLVFHVFVGMKLPHRVAKLSRISQTQRHVARHASQGVATVGQSLHAPLLVAVSGVGLPLDDRLQPAVAPIVECLCRGTVQQLIDAVGHLHEFPHLTGLAFRTGTQKDGGLVAHCSTIVEQETRRSLHLVGTLLVDGEGRLVSLSQTSQGSQLATHGQ